MEFCITLTIFQAQKALNNCILGNTSIHANVASENDVLSIFQRLGGKAGGSSGDGAPGGPGGAPPAVSSAAGSSMWGSAAPSSGSVWGAPDASMNNFLPNDLLQ